MNSDQDNPTTDQYKKKDWPTLCSISDVNQFFEITQYGKSKFFTL